MALFTINLKDQRLPGYTNPLDVDVNVQSILITSGNLQAQWSIELPQSGNQLEGSSPLPPLFDGNLDMECPTPVIDSLTSFFNVSAPGLVANLSAKANAK